MGATFPEEAGKLRKIMNKSYFLVPGYGAQGEVPKKLYRVFMKTDWGTLLAPQEDKLLHNSYNSRKKEVL